VSGADLGPSACPTYPRVVQITLMDSVKATLTRATHVPYCCTGMLALDLPIPAGCLQACLMLLPQSRLMVRRCVFTCSPRCQTGAVTDFGEALQTRGSLKREPQGVIRTFEAFQLHLIYGWHVLLHQLRDLTKWWAPVQKVLHKPFVELFTETTTCHSPFWGRQQHGLCVLALSELQFS
jgi:hypothetical protein